MQSHLARGQESHFKERSARSEPELFLLNFAFKDILDNSDLGYFVISGNSFNSTNH
jgi:hypothetical protein